MLVVLGVACLGRVGIIHAFLTRLFSHMGLYDTLGSGEIRCDDPFKYSPTWAMTLILGKQGALGSGETRCTMLSVLGKQGVRTPSKIA